MRSNLQTPGVGIWEPPSARPMPLAWDQLKFNPLGLFDLRRRLGVLPSQPNIFATFRDRFIASDIAWLATGIAGDGAHRVPADTFHPQFLEIRNEYPIGSAGLTRRKDLESQIRRLIFDLVRGFFLKRIILAHLRY